MRVLKFGGKSLSSKEKVQKICKFIKKIYKNDKKIIVIVSAMGNQTDELIKKAKDFSGEKCKGLSGGKCFERELAILMSTGETQSAALFAMTLESMNVPAKSLGAHDIEIETFGSPTNSRIAYINKLKLKKELDSEVVCVVAGFQGIGSDNTITTLGRGGSDTTATAIAAIFDCNAEIYSDFDGVFSGDPRELDFKKAKSLGFNSMINMAKSGAKVLNERATIVAKKFNIDILSKSSSEPNLSGSTISEIEDDTISIQSLNHLCLITITFSCNERFEFISKNVITLLKNINFYNLNIKNDNVSFLVYAEEKTEVLTTLSKKLHLLKQEK
jgi:aspartate kinase